MKLPIRLRRKFALAFAAILCAPLSAALAGEPQGTHDESRVKAAFLVRFLQYIEWPQEVLDQSAPRIVGVVGAEAVATELLQLASAKGVSPRMAVRSLKSGDDLAQVHVLFIGMDEKARLAQHLSAVRGKPILVVTETAGALEQGSMINFVLVERRVRFEIGLDAAEKAKLVVSSRLLAVAMRVHKALHTGDLLARHPFPQ